MTQEPSFLTSHLSIAKESITDIIDTYLNAPQGDILAREKANNFFSTMGMNNPESITNEFFTKLGANPEAVEAVRGSTKADIEKNFTNDLMAQYGPILSLLAAAATQ